MEPIQTDAAGGRKEGRRSEPSLTENSTGWKPPAWLNHRFIFIILCYTVPEITLSVCLFFSVVNYNGSTPNLLRNSTLGANYQMVPTAGAL